LDDQLRQSCHAALTVAHVRERNGGSISAWREVDGPPWGPKNAMLVGGVTTKEGAGSLAGSFAALIEKSSSGAVAVSKVVIPAVHRELWRMPIMSLIVIPNARSQLRPTMRPLDRAHARGAEADFSSRSESRHAGCDPGRRLRTTRCCRHGRRFRAVARIHAVARFGPLSN
jgi:hypothetical protein